MDEDPVPIPTSDDDDLPIRPLLHTGEVDIAGKGMTTYEINFRAGLGNRPIEHFIYAGGDFDEHERWFKKLYPGRDPPAHSDHCLCTHFIVNNCYIYHKDDPNTLLVTGSCCIKRFKIQGRSCKKCHNPNRNRDVWCTDCRGGVFHFGLHNGACFRRVLDDDFDYCVNIIKSHRSGPSRVSRAQGTKETRQFATWLRNQKEIIDYLGQEAVEAEARRVRTDRDRRLIHNDTVLGFGKTHSGDKYSKIWTTDRSYCAWALKQDSLNPLMKRFQEWLRDKTASL